MSEQKHSPGSWKVEEERGGDSGNEFAIGVSSDDWIVADVWANIASEEAAVANARLIAAAPELLKALKSLVAASNEPSLEMDDSSEEYYELRAAMRSADVVIAKAEGRS